jgi:hypothetical protein
MTDTTATPAAWLVTGAHRDLSSHLDHDDA